MSKEEKIICGDSLEVLKDFEDNYFDSVVTDPPYGLAFMGKKWDYDVPEVELWKEVYRVLKPGGHILSFAGSRTYHRMAVNIEDAGFEIRDMLGWLYGSGFPKSHNIGKAVDKFGGRILGKEVGKIIKEKRKELGYSTIQLAEIGKFYGKKNHGGTVSNWETGNGNITPEQFNSLIKILNLKDNPIIENKRQFIKKDKNWGKKGNIPLSAYKDFDVTKGNSKWEGWGTALKPAHEPIVMARKPFNTSVAENVLTHGTGGINIDECRVGGKEGRFPANIIHDGSEEVLEIFPDSKGVVRKPTGKKILDDENGWNQNKMIDSTIRGFNDKGTAARFFYCAKASKAERNMGLDDFEGKYLDPQRKVGSKGGTNPRNRGAESKRKNYHPTVKPIKLMEYLVRLVTPKEGIVLEPFAGSGTTLIACKQQGFNYIGIEKEQEYCDIAEARLKSVQIQGTLF
jgi:DNA modification methylase/transcriptional regulator with XRE-family HTH domain